MELSIFLGKVFGAYLVVVGVACLIRRDELERSIKSFYDTPALVLLGSVVNLLIGFLIIFSHSVFELSWRVVITFVGYMSLLKGIMHLFFPEKGRELAGKMVKGNTWQIMGVLMTVFGSWLLYQSFLNG